MPFFFACWRPLAKSKGKGYARLQVTRAQPPLLLAPPLVFGQTFPAGVVVGSSKSIFGGAAVSVVAFGGSRSLSPAWGALVSSVVSAVLSSGGSVAAGCAAGADQLAVSSVLAQGAAPRLALFCVGAASGAGFWSGSAPLSLLRAAAGAGSAVAWCAGGGPALPFRARLLRRSLAALAGCSAAVFFLASPSSPGSLRVAAAAALRGLPVFVFPCGFSGAPALLAGCAGAWIPSVFCGFPCLAWQPAAVQVPLF